MGSARYDHTEVVVFVDAFSTLTKIAILIHDVDGRKIYNPCTKELRKIDESLRIDSFDDMFLKIPYEMHHSFFKAMAEVLDKRGIKTENDSKLQGTIEATRYHLEDMRALLKLKK